MKLFEIAVPTKANDGASYDVALSMWEDVVLKTAGGFTRMPDVDGYWRDPSNGKLYKDRMRGYRVALGGYHERDTLVREAFKIFPDQVAIFVSEIGSATIVNREDVRPPLAAV